MHLVDIFVIYGISQDPDTNDYILVLKNFTLTSGNKKIDSFIQNMQLIMNKSSDTIFEWIPYNRLYEIKEIGKNSSDAIHLAIWKDGPLYKKNRWSKYTRDYSKKEVALKCLHYSQNIIESVINEVYAIYANIFVFNTC
jgi:hypothetical protein